MSVRSQFSRSAPLKQALRSVLPATLVASMVELRDRRHLATLPTAQLDLTNLTSTASDFDRLRSAFDAEMFAKSWAADSKRLQALLGEAGLNEGVNLGDGRALYYAVRTFMPSRVLEVGTHIGASTSHIAVALAHGNRHRQLTTVDTVDVNDPAGGPWVALGLAHSPRQVVERLNTGVEVQFVQARGADFMDSCGERFDLIFLDGSHAADDVYREVAAASRVLSRGGLLLLHDVYPGGRPLFPESRVIRGPYEALARLEQENPEIQTLAFGSLPWPTRRGSHATSLALLARRMADD